MKYNILTGLLFIWVQTAVGQEISNYLPRPVVKSLNKQFERGKVALTEKKRAAQAYDHDKFFIIHNNEKNERKGYLHYGRVKTCRAGGCDAPGTLSAAENHDSEYFDYLIFFTPDFRIEKVKIFNYQASYGHEITASGWLKQFRGYSGHETLEVGKDVDIISGATISVEAITNDIILKTSLLKNIFQ